MRNSKNYAFLLMILSMFVLLMACGKEANQQNETVSEGDSSSEEKTENINYPEKPIRIVVPFGAGGNTDIMARAIGDVLPKYLPKDQPIVVENIGGGGGTIGIAEVVKAKADGYVLGLGTASTFALQPNYEDTPYALADIEPITQLTSVPTVLVVSNDAPWETFEDWLEYIKANPDQFTYGTAGAGIITHLAMEDFSKKADVKIKHVPHDGGNAAIASFLGGHIDGVNIQASEALPLIEQGQARALVNTGTSKSDLIIDATLLSDKGFDVGIDSTTGVIGPKGMPTEIVNILNDAFEQTMNDPEIVELFNGMGLSTAVTSSEEYKEILEKDFDDFGNLLKQLGFID